MNSNMINKLMYPKSLFPAQMSLVLIPNASWTSLGIFAHFSIAILIFFIDLCFMVINNIVGYIVASHLPVCAFSLAFVCGVFSYTEI